jgi:glyoxylase-like metal-dependent hydrolase (beta-lactamase superfamily II)
MFQLGDLRIYPICDSKTLSDPGGMFGLVPRKLWSRVKTPNEEHLIDANSLCLLVQAGGKNILVDTGMGEGKLDEKGLKRWGLTRPYGSLFGALGRAGLTADDIHIVINTHLHADHCLGNTRPTPDGGFEPSFPNAVYYVQARELEDARHPNERTAATYLAVNFEPIAQRGQFHLLDGDAPIVDGVRVVVTRGHTPAHMSVVLEGGGQSALFVCDMASMSVHFEKLAWMTAYDVEPLLTLESKRRWQAWALETNALLFFVHDWEIPAARLVKGADGALMLQPEALTYL